MAYRQAANLIAGVVAALLAATAAEAAEGGRPLTIEGTLALAPGAAAALRPGDRLVIKIYNPGNGVDNDPSFRIMSEFSLPMDFRMSPPIDMNGNARWSTYIIEAYTDRDGKVDSVSADELFATTGEALPLGTTGVALELAPAPTSD